MLVPKGEVRKVPVWESLALSGYLLPTCSRQSAPGFTGRSQFCEISQLSCPLLSSCLGFTYPGPTSCSMASARQFFELKRGGRLKSTSTVVP